MESRSRGTENIHIPKPPEEPVEKTVPQRCDNFADFVEVAKRYRPKTINVRPNVFPVSIGSKILSRLIPGCGYKTELSATFNTNGAVVKLNESRKDCPYYLLKFGASQKKRVAQKKYIERVAWHAARNLQGEFPSSTVFIALDKKNLTVQEAKQHFNLQEASLE